MRGVFTARASNIALSAMLFLVIIRTVSLLGLKETKSLLGEASYVKRTGIAVRLPDAVSCGSLGVKCVVSELYRLLVMFKGGWTVTFEVEDPAEVDKGPNFH